MRAAALMALLALTACTTYIPHTIEPPPPTGTEVKARLTTPGAIRVTDLMGQPVRELEGTLVAWSTDSLQIALLSATEYGRPWDSVDTLGLAITELSFLEEKRINTGRTVLFVGATAAVAGIVIAALWKAAVGGDDGEDPGEIDLIRIPIFSFIH